MQDDAAKIAHQPSRNPDALHPNEIHEVRRFLPYAEELIEKHKFWSMARGYIVTVSKIVTWVGGTIILARAVFGNVFTWHF